MRRLVVSAAVLAVFVTATSAGAGVVDRVTLASASELTSAFPAGTSLRLASPPAYEAGNQGDVRGGWRGPRYQSTGDPNDGGRTVIAWSVRFAAGSYSPLRAARTGLVRGWPEDAHTGVAVPHVIGRRIVGFVPGQLVVAQAPGGSSVESAVAFAVTFRVFAIVRFELTGPPTDLARAGRYVVDGVPVSLWNRGQAFWAGAGVALEGNLPPTSVTLKASRRGGVLTGRVADAFHHPVVGARVVLERLSGGSWIRAGATMSGPRGGYTLRRVRSGARYRVVAAISGSAARSEAVVVGG